MPTPEARASCPDGVDGGIGHAADRARSIKRLLVLPAAVAIQACLGGVYAWSAFAAPLRADFALTATQTQFVFGVTIAAFTLSMAVAGRWIGRFGTRRTALCGGVLFGIGHLASAGSGGAFVWILTGSGGLVGIGTGLGYVSALTTVGQWFPRRRGLAIGVAVAGFGAGAILLSEVVSRLLQGGRPVLDVFREVGVAYAVVIVLAAALLFRAPPSAACPAEQVALTKPRLARDSLPLIVGMFGGTFAGLLVIGDLASLGLEGGLSPQWATAAIGGFAVGNAAGRIAWGWLADRVGYRTIPVSLLFLAVALIALHAARGRTGFFLTAATLSGFGFGANFVLYAAQTALRHGARGLATLYPRIFLAYGLAGITGPSMGGHLHDVTGAYAPAIGIAVVLLLVAAGITAATEPTCPA